MSDNVLRPHAEQQYAEELAELSRVDDRPCPPNWKLSPWAAATRSFSAAVAWQPSPGSMTSIRQECRRPAKLPDSSRLSLRI